MDIEDFFKTAVGYKKLFPEVPLPEYATKGSSGADIKVFLPEFNLEVKDNYQSSFVLLHPGETRKIRTGLCLQIPDGFELQIRPRSSLNLKGIVAFGTIDSDYRGEIHVVVSNISNSPVKIHHGDRIAQGVLAKVEKIRWIELPELDETERGSGGFGHTGV